MILKIVDEIGYFGISVADVEAEISKLKEGESLDVIIDSPGGSVFDGIAIFNLIRKEAKARTVNVEIIGIAASMATYIALAGRAHNANFTVKVYDNTVFMIHNAWTVAIGDHQVLKQKAVILENLSKITAEVYALFGEKDIKKIRKQMDAETWLFGQEIVDAGFATEIEHIIPIDDESVANTKDTIVMLAKNKFKTMQEKSTSSKKDDMNQIAALLNIKNQATDGSDDKKPAQIKTEENMTKEELQKSNPAIFSEIYEDGKQAGIVQENERVLAHLKLGETAKSLETSARFIKEGKDISSAEVISEYMSLNMKNMQASAGIADNPPDVSVGADDEADQAAALKAYNAGLANKKEF
ncbi:MAG: head maturation protease, ClpP-related [Treponemataceae bacterium]